jgi:NAD-dependent deacetylase
MESALESLTDRLAELIISSKRMIVFTGAGVSTESGISDFRSPGGLWEKYDPAEFTYQNFLRSAENRKKHWQIYRSGIFIDENIKPNAAHYAIAELERMGKLECVITQNVDNLHQKAGVPAEKVIELHGNMKWVKCLSCGKRTPMDEVVKRMAEESVEDPHCKDCQGILKPEGIFFGESLPEKALREATFYSTHCDLFIVIGSTLIVTPAAFMPSYAVESGAKLAIINLSSTPLDRQASILICGKAGEVMSKVLDKMRRKSPANFKNLQIVYKKEGK